MLAVAAAVGSFGMARAEPYPVYDPVQWTVASGGNGHWYDLVLTASTWTEARDFAAASTFMGMSGYLATITSQAEEDFLGSLVWGGLNYSNGWIGASDEGSEGTWYWATGPEIGQVFYKFGAATQPGYSNWANGQPDNANGFENYAFLNSQLNGKWADFAEGSNTGYMVEYSPAQTNQQKIDQVNARRQAVAAAKEAASHKQTSMALTPNLSPVPLPGTLPLMGSALAALGLVRRRRKSD